MVCVPAGYGEQFGRVVATPGVAEKGYLDVMINVASPGGHSSLPPPHTVGSYLLYK
jgi:Gly-Xaa carboxypeptidase